MPLCTTSRGLASDVCCRGLAVSPFRELLPKENSMDSKGTQDIWSPCSGSMGEVPRSQGQGISGLSGGPPVPADSSP